MKMPLDKKDYAKIPIIAGIVIVPLLVGVYAIQIEDNNMRFWSEWECDQLMEFVRNPEFDGITEQQHVMFQKDLEACTNQIP